MSFFSKVNVFGGILIIIDALFELFDATRNPYAWPSLLTILLGVLIIAVTPQFEGNYKMQYGAFVIVAQTLATFTLHVNLGLNWALPLGSLYIGAIGCGLVWLAGLVVVLFESLAVHVLKSSYVFKETEIFLFGVELVALETTISIFVKSVGMASITAIMNELICFGFLAVSLIGILLVWKKRTLTGALIIWASNAINGILTGISGFGGGSIVLSLYAMILAIFTLNLKWMNGYKKRIKVPRNLYGYTIKDSLMGFWLGLLRGLSKLGEHKKNK